MQAIGIAFIILLLIHGTIHLAGFFSGSRISVKLFDHPVSTRNRLLWLSSAILFLFALLALLFDKKTWWIPCLAALVVSQAMILSHWRVARFGTIVNVIILIACFSGYSTWSFYRTFVNDVAANAKHNTNTIRSVLTEDDMRSLPEPVKKYLRYSGCVGKPKVSDFKIEFSGKIRKDENSGWMPFTSEQYNFMEQPARLFFMNAVMKRLPVAGYHSYQNGEAFMDIRLFSAFKVQFMDGDEMNKAETVTFFNDMCCLAPATLIDDRIQWEDKGNNTVGARFTNKGSTISAELFFNELGQLINFRSDDRYNAEAGKKLPWSTPLSDYRNANGYTLAAHAETIYTYPWGDFCYGTFDVRSAAFNLSEK